MECFKGCIAQSKYYFCIILYRFCIPTFWEQTKSFTLNFTVVKWPKYGHNMHELNTVFGYPYLKGMPTL